VAAALLAGCGSGDDNGAPGGLPDTPACRTGQAIFNAAVAPRDRQSGEETSAAKLATMIPTQYQNEPFGDIPLEYRETAIALIYEAQTPQPPAADVAAATDALREGCG
jgi:hypothetical protein